MLGTLSSTRPQRKSMVRAAAENVNPALNPGRQLNDSSGSIPCLKDLPLTRNFGSWYTNYRKVHLTFKPLALIPERIHGISHIRWLFMVPVITRSHFSFVEYFWEFEEGENLKKFGMKLPFDPLSERRYNLQKDVYIIYQLNKVWNILSVVFASCSWVASILKWLSIFVRKSPLDIKSLPPSKQNDNSIATVYVYATVVPKADQFDKTPGKRKPWNPFSGTLHCKRYT